MTAAVVYAVAAGLIDKLAEAGVGGFAVLTAIALPADGAAQVLAGVIFAKPDLVKRIEGADAVLQAAAQLLAEAELKRGIK